MLHHIEINVSNLEKTKMFWGWLMKSLGYETFQQWESGISWKQESTYLVFVQTMYQYLPSAYHRSHTGLNHLAFHASSRRQVDDLTLELKRKGVKILYEDRHPYAGGPNHYAVFFEDPDRIKVELVAP
ncbi:VOC family protein [Heyndrickxia acidicola]|uniref:VOC family protein n=1 Tax=Heyndrickxia acidicola TaxID=209389 RepID=A0ABU6MIH0_9BACI|nr:VOC family protein [Heyndrickxia acidicola]MED1202860.1 VOC family protein [Heyndrickxia acidicola]